MNKVFKETIPLLKNQFGEELTKKIMDNANIKYNQLCVDNKDETKAVKQHTVKNIYPCISLYNGMIDSGIEDTKALEFLDWSYSKRAEKKAKSIQNMMKLPGMYKLMPRIFKWVTIHQFGEKAGFKAKFYDTPKTRIKFDMTQCLYCQVCKQNNCPQLVPCFCHVDDVTDGNMHKKLKWNRTKTMGEGQDVCDFDLFVEEEK